MPTSVADLLIPTVDSRSSWPFCGRLAKPQAMHPLPDGRRMSCVSRRLVSAANRTGFTYGIKGSSMRRRRYRSSSCPAYACDHVLHSRSSSGPSGIRLIPTNLNSWRIAVNVSPAPIATKTALRSMSLKCGLAASATAQATLASCTSRSTITTYSQFALAQSWRPAPRGSEGFSPLPTGRPRANHRHSS
jgi:hypothetical protein